MAGVFTEEDFDALLRKVEAKLGDMQQQARVLTDRVNSAVRWMGPFGDGVTRLMNTMWEWIKKIGIEIAKFFSQPGVPWTLWSHGSAWAGPPIAGRISKLVILPTLDGVKSDDYWHGSAADAYRNTLPRQKEALAALVETAHGIDDVLTKVAVAFGAFWLAVLTAVAAFVIELTAESGAAAAVVTAPAAAAAGGISAAKAIGFILAAVTALYVFFISETLPAIKDLEQTLHNRTAFGEQWPSSTTFDLSDGRLSDGDSTNWHIKS